MDFFEKQTVKKDRLTFWVLTIFLSSILIFGFRYKQAKPKNEHNSSYTQDSIYIESLIKKAASKITYNTPHDSARYYIQLALVYNDSTINDSNLEAHLRYLYGGVTKDGVYAKRKEYFKALELVERDHPKELTLKMSTYRKLIHGYYYQYDNSVDSILLLVNKAQKYYKRLGKKEQAEIEETYKNISFFSKSMMAYKSLGEEKIMELRKKEKNATEYTRQANTLFHRFGKYDSAYHYRILADSLLENILEEVDSYWIWRLYLRNLDEINVLHEQEELMGKRRRSSGKTYQDLIDLIDLSKEKLDIDDRLRNYLLCGCASYIGITNPSKALPYFLESLEGYEETNCKSWLADFYVDLGDFEKAVQIYESSLVVFTDDYNVGLLSQRIAKVHFQAGNMDEAIFYTQKSYPLLHKTLQPTHPRLSIANDQMARVHVHEGKYEHALPLINKAISIFSAAATPEVTELLPMYITKARILAKLNDFEAATDELKKAYKCLRNTINPAKRTEIQLANVEILAIQNKYTEALDTLDLAKQLLRADVTELDQIEFKRDLLKVYVLEGEILFQQTEKLASLEFMEVILESSKEAIELIDAIRRTYSWEVSKKEVLNKTEGLFQKGIQAALQLYEMTADKQYAQQAFTFSEKHKAIILLEVIQNENQHIFSSLPKKVLEREQELKLMLNSFEQKRFTENQKPSPDPFLIQLYESSIFKLSNAYDSLTLAIREEYPEYYKLSRKVGIVDIPTVQNKALKEGKTLIEYQLQGKVLYAFIIQSDFFEVVKIPVKINLQEYIQQLRKSTYSYQLSAKKTEALKLTSAENFVESAHELFLQLVAPISQIHPISNELIIVPDGELGYIPFSLLLKSLPTKPTQFGTHDYLIKDYQISYSYSATLLQEMQNRQVRPAKNKLLAFAPHFTGKVRLANANRSIEDVRNELYELTYNVSEVEKINEVIGGTVYIGEKATENRFWDEAPSYAILHLSTHGKANDQVGDFAFLAFTEQPDSIENEFLYNRDLYNIKLNAEMVVLSACETGIGELQKGEGIISLARGFSYAGAKSIITSLWSVNDAATEELMEQFYINLKEGMSKDAALRKAKLVFLETHLHDAHPFFWASFVPIGDMNPIDLAEYPLWYWGGLIIGIILAGCWIKKFV